MFFKIVFQVYTYLEETKIWKLLDIQVQEQSGGLREVSPAELPGLHQECLAPEQISEQIFVFWQRSQEAGRIQGSGRSWKKYRWQISGLGLYKGQLGYCFKIVSFEHSGLIEK